MVRGLQRGIFFTRSCALSSVVDSGRALGSGNLARVSLSGVFGFRRLTSVMVEGLPAPYVGSWVATGAATVLLVLVLIFSSLLIISFSFDIHLQGFFGGPDCLV